MRILSQTGIVDLPYESIGISRNNTEIVATPIADSNPQERYWTLAEYSAEEKARKAMEMLREAYSPIMIIQEQDEGIKPNTKPNNWFFTPALPTQRIEIVDNFYFQFPADDEVEV